MRFHPTLDGFQPEQSNLCLVWRPCARRANSVPTQSFHFIEIVRVSLTIDEDRAGWAKTSGWNRARTAIHFHISSRKRR